MPIFHIHLFNDAEVLDESGQEFRDADAARDEAVRSGREIIAEHILQGRPINPEHHLIVEDAQGQRLAKILFGELICFDGQT
ncbi:DUF6894 family protein [Sphingobium bisphenolivorans]|uniref:DUF6894 family protein n=1 Tax=Sphingobium bisphenolivorans TaxID=1335760 RepID=UPI0003A4F4FF|nr:hypothetical protein [Sphingobium bisphenolivorans]